MARPQTAWITVEEAALTLRLNAWDIRDLIADGTLETTPDGRTVLVRRADCDALARSFMAGLALAEGLAKARRDGLDDQAAASAMGLSPKVFGKISRQIITLEGTSRAAVRDYLMSLHLQHLEAAQQIVDSPGYLHDLKGDLVREPDGSFSPDIPGRTRALEEMRHGLESVRRLLGTDAPQQKQITIEETRVDRTIEELQRRILEQARRRELDNAVEAEVIED